METVIKYQRKIEITVTNYNNELHFYITPNEMCKEELEFLKAIFNNYEKFFKINSTKNIGLVE